MTQAQIADATGLSQVHISRLLRRSLHLHPSFDPTVLFTAPAAGERVCRSTFSLSLSQATSSTPIRSAARRGATAPGQAGCDHQAFGYRKGDNSSLRRT
jgi:hypothetical protein